MARSFNGSSDQISCGTGVPFPAAVTLSAWVRFVAFTNAYNTVMGQNNGTDFYQLHVKSTGKLAVYVETGASINYDGSGANTLSTNTWYNLSFSYSNAANLTGYVNGSVDGTSGSGSGNLLTGSATFGIGYDPSNASRNVNGSIAHVAQWNTVLTAGEIVALSKGALPYTIRTGALQGYWPLDGLVSPEPDFSGNKNNGTLTGTALASGPPVMQFTPRQPQVTPFAASASSVVFRRSLSPVGTRTGARQAVA